MLFSSAKLRIFRFCVYGCAFCLAPPEHRKNHSMNKYFQGHHRKAAMMLATCLIAAGFVATAPAVTASAEEIDCSYTPGLQDYIGNGRDGYTCGRTTGVTPSSPVYGSPNLSGQAVPGHFTGSLCRFPLAPLPDYFYSRGVVTSTSVTLDGEDGAGNPIYHTVTNYSRADQKLVGVRVITWMPGKFMNQTFFDTTLGKEDDGGVDIIQSQDCRNDDDWNVENVTNHIDDDPGATAPTGPITPTTGVTSTATLTAVPGKPREYFLRVDVTNHNPSTLLSTFASIDMGFDDFAVTSVIQSPNDASCPITTYRYGNCNIVDLPAGDTRSFLYLVTARPDAPVDASVPVTSISFGYFREHYVGLVGGIYTTSAAHATLAP
jgi:hypothetical protein